MSITIATGGDREALNKGDYSSMDRTVTYEGAVIQLWERNGYHDSDFYALVYDAEEDRLKAVEYATTRGWTYGNGAKVDITPENLALAEKAAAREALAILTAKARDKAEAVEPGKVVELSVNFRGRTQPSAKIGEQAQVQSVFDDRYDYSYYTGKYGQKAKVTFADGREINLSVDKLKVVDPEQYMPTDLEDQANRWAARSAQSLNFRGIYEGWLY